jgi:hypothetical protein
MKMFDINSFNVKKFDEILAKGLSDGLGERGQQICIEAAICQVLDLPHGDDPGCVSKAVRAYKITLNDSCWSSPTARAAGLRDLGLAQLGSLGTVDDSAFAQILVEKTIRTLIPKLFRSAFSNNAFLLAAADRCEQEGTQEAATAASMAAGATNAAYIAYTATRAARAARYVVENATHAADYIAYTARAAAFATHPLKDDYLVLSAKLALETLQELNSPGIALL